MTGINYGILSNAIPLSAEAIKELERRSVEENQIFVYLNTEGRLCFSTPHGVDGLKELAWHKAYELSKENDTITRKIYVKTGLKTFELADTVIEDPNAGSDPLIVLDNYSTERGGFLLVNDTPIDLGGYEDADVQIVYSVNDGEKKTFNALMHIFVDSMPTIMEITCILEGTEESGLLFACYPNLDGNTMGEGSSTMVQPTGDYAYPNTYKVTIWSITKVASEVKNLLSEPITLTCDGSGAPAFQNNPFLIGIEGGKQYKVKADVDGENLSVVCKADEFEGMVVLSGIDTEMPYLGGAMLVVYDGCHIEGDQPVYGSTYSTIGVVSNDDQPHTVILSHIIGTRNQAPVNLLSEPIAYTEDDIQLNRSLGLVDGKSYKLEGVYGSDATPFSITATAIDVCKYALDNAPEGAFTDEVRTIYEEGVGIISLEVDVPTPNGSNPDGEIYVYVNDNGQDRGIDVLKYVENTCLIEFGWGAAGIDGSTFVLNSITEVESTDSGSI